MTKEPLLQYKSSRWINPDGRTISTCLVYDPVHVEVLVENPMRKQTVTSLIKVLIFKDNAILPDEKVKEESRILTLPPLSTGTISVRFTPVQESGYHYMVLIEGEKTFDQPKQFPPRLYASRKKSILILNEPSNGVLPGSTVTFAGKLVSTDAGDGITGAKVHIYDTRHMRRDNLMASGTTGNDGTFIIERIVKRMHWWDHNVEIYAKFEGDDVYKPSISNQCSVNLAPISTVDMIPIPQNSSNQAKL